MDAVEIFEGVPRLVAMAVISTAAVMAFGISAMLWDLGKRSLRLPTRVMLGAVAVPAGIACAALWVHSTTTLILLLGILL